MASQLSSQTGLEIRSTQSKREASIRWTDTEVQKIVNWLFFRDGNGDLANLTFVKTSNKLEASRRMVIDCGLDNKPGVTFLKGRDKVINMISLCKKWRDIADRTGWGVNPDEHHHTGVGPIRMFRKSSTGCLFKMETRT